MEPLKIQIEVSLSEATIAALKDLMVSATLPSLVRAVPPGAVEKMAEAMKQAVSIAQAEPSPVTEIKAPETAPNPPKPKAEKPKKAEEPVPAEEVSELQLFEAVKAAQKVRGIAPKTVREVFKEFGISASSECPAERRKELLDRINAL